MGLAQAAAAVRAGAESTLTMLSADPHADDVWCVDPHGLLTLHLAPETYQALGLPGAKLPFKGHTTHSESCGYVRFATLIITRPAVALALHPGADAASGTNRQKRDVALRAWDERRAQPWRVLYSAGDAGETARVAAANGHADGVGRVACQTATSRAVRVPVPTLCARPADPDAVEDWEAEMRALFEWVGMAGFGAQRLQANDRADAFVAVYEPPAPSVVGDVTHLRWRGFLGPVFVQSVVDVVLSAVSTQFVSITSHAFPTSPVSYIPPVKAGKHQSLKRPARVPRSDGEDTWCVIVASDGRKTRWCMAESISSWDTRWG
ncbi:hypothetical protein B0H10DRAFT_1128238 [Mycena sp. CBHHK59/15]|nr:hypothetical protein B0H10DRAFT_1128238 [Mycena sp. CBHHK59/15]